MNKKNSKKISQIDFTGITPEIQIEKINNSKIYKKAFLDKKQSDKSDHSRNTTTWE